MASPTLITGSVIVRVTGGLAVGDVPFGATHETAKDMRYDWPGGILLTRAAGSLTGKMLTVVPAGKAPAGTVTAPLATCRW